MWLEFKKHLADMWARRFALVNLVLKDFRVRYRNMSLGVLWSVLNPLVMLATLSFVFTCIFPRRQENFPMFLLLGLVAYNFFAMCMSAAIVSIPDNAPLVKKVVFPRVFLPISAVAAQSIHMLIQLALLWVFIIFFSIPVSWAYLWLIPVYAVELIFIMGMALICASLNVFYRDMQYLVESALLVLFWLSPILYSVSRVRDSLPRPLYVLYMINPLAPIIDACRRVVLEGLAPNLAAFAFCAVVSILTLVVGLVAFTKCQKGFADNV
jgi:ABC-type polysaccharide/polyol phosphate export permease